MLKNRCKIISYYSATYGIELLYKYSLPKLYAFIVDRNLLLFALRKIFFFSFFSLQEDMQAAYLPFLHNYRYYR